MISRHFALRRIAIAATCFATLSSATAAVTDTLCSKNCFEKRWVYFAGDIVSSPAVYDKLIAVMKRAKALGYNGIALNGGGGAAYSVMQDPRPGSMPSKYRAVFAAAAKAAEETQIELIPIGGGMEVPGIRDASLLEAMPATNTPFLVEGANAYPIGDALIKDSEDDKSFELDPPAAAWRLIDSSTTYDTTVHRNGQRSVKFTQKNPAGFSRVFREVKLRKHAAFRMSFWMRSENYDGKLRIQIMDAPLDAAPIYQNASSDLGFTSVLNGWSKNVLPATQDQWVKYSIDFNTGNNEIARIWIGTWTNSATQSGAAWLDDIEIKEIGLAHAIRRDSLPITVSSEDGSIVYVEGKDYKVDIESLQIPQTTSIRPGQRLAVTAYQSAQNMISMFGTPANSCNGRYFEIQAENYRQIVDLLSQNQVTPSEKIFLYYDENRVFNWDPSCKTTTAGGYLRDTFLGHQNAILKVNPNAELFVWHDMFDPNANAIEKYWAVNGSLKDSSDGILERTTVVNWTNSKKGHPVESLKFFSDKKRKQIIAGYYDDETPELDEMRAWLAALDTAESQGVTGVNGFMYTTFTGKFDDLEAVTKYIKEHSNRWPE